MLLFLLIAMVFPVSAISPGAVKTFGPLETQTTRPVFSPVKTPVATATATSTTNQMASLTIESDPPGAEIWMFGNKTLYITPYSSPAYPWSYYLVLKLPGYEPYSTSFNLQSGQVYTVNAKLKPLSTEPAQTWNPPPSAIQTADLSGSNLPKSPTGEVTPAASVSPRGSPPVQSTGSLTVTTNPAGASVEVDSVPAGASPATIPGLSAGPHNITITKPGYAVLVTQVNIVAGQANEYSTTLLPSTAPTKKQSPGFELIPAALAVAGIALLKRIR